MVWVHHYHLSIEKDVTIVLKMVKKWIEQSFALECRSLASDIIYGLSFQMPNYVRL